VYGMTLLVEDVRRARVAGRDVVLAHGHGDVLSSQATALLGSGSAL
jgi:hypothetical protein